MSKENERETSNFIDNVTDFCEKQDGFNRELINTFNLMRSALLQTTARLAEVEELLQTHNDFLSTIQVNQKGKVIPIHTTTTTTDKKEEEKEKTSFGKPVLH